MSNNSGRSKFQIRVENEPYQYQIFKQLSSLPFDIIRRMEAKQDNIISKLQQNSLIHIESIISSLINNAQSRIQQTIIDQFNKRFNKISEDFINIISNQSHFQLSGGLVPLQKKEEIGEESVGVVIQMEVQQLIEQHHKKESERDRQNIIGKYKDDLSYQSQLDEINSSEIPFYYEEVERSMVLLNYAQDIPELFSNSTLLFESLKSRFEEMQLHFTACQIVYEFPQMRQINFHQKIDGRNNIFLLIELENNQTIGAFTHLCFDPKPLLIPKQNPKSFICNLNSDKNIFLYAAVVNKTHCYDKNYLIFGNWEIKIKYDDDLFETNWGTNGDVFLRREYGKGEKASIKVEWLFGNGANMPLKMRRYHIYIFT